MFALGWVLHRAPSRPAEFASLAVALVLPFVIWGGARDWPAWIENGPWWISFGCVLLVLLKTTPLPAPIDRFAYLIGGASLFIYISHYPVKGIWDRISPVQSAALDIGVALAAGVAFWLSWEAGMRWVAALWKRAFPPRAAEAGLDAGDQLACLDRIQPASERVADREDHHVRDRAVAQLVGVDPRGAPVASEAVAEPALAAGQHFEVELTRERVAQLALEEGQSVRLLPSRLSLFEQPHAARAAGAAR